VRSCRGRGEVGGFARGADRECGRAVGGHQVRDVGPLAIRPVVWSGCVGCYLARAPAMVGESGMEVQAFDGVLLMLAAACAAEAGS
jgi:hypothetical protein